jgi:hypothetical protein
MVAILLHYLVRINVEERCTDTRSVAQHEIYLGKTPVHDPTNKRAVVQREIAAIPEASTRSRKSKRKAQSVDEHSLDRA